MKLLLLLRLQKSEVRKKGIDLENNTISLSFNCVHSGESLNKDVLVNIILLGIPIRNLVEVRPIFKRPARERSSQDHRYKERDRHF